MSQEDPIVHVIPNPVLLDKAIAKIQSAMGTLPWIQKSFARAFKRFKIVEGSKVSYPAIFQKWKGDYYTAFPNDRLTGQSFVFVSPSEITEYDTRKIHYIKRNVSIIISFDLEKIDNALEYRFTEKLKEDVIIVLATIGKSSLEINNITDELEDVFGDFSVSEIESVFFKERYGSLKFDCTIFYKNETCDLNVYNP